MILEEVGYGDRDGVIEATVLCSIFCFFGVDVALVDTTHNMGDENFTIGLRFTDFIFFKVDVLDAFVWEGRSSI